MIRRCKADVLTDLPPKLRTFISVSVSNDSLKVWHSLQEISSGAYMSEPTSPIKSALKSSRYPFTLVPSGHHARSVKTVPAKSWGCDWKR